MKSGFDLREFSRAFFVALIGLTVGYMLFAMMSVEEANKEKQAEKIKGIIDKALIQCYALEGSYPNDLRYLEKDGVVFQDDKFVYDYSPLFYNTLPPVTVISID